MAFAVNHFSMSDRSQPPDMCFGGNSPFLHHRKSVDRLTPTTRTTSPVDSRTSMPANRSITDGRVGASSVGVSRLRTGGTTSMSDNCTGRSPVPGLGRFEPFERAIRRSDVRGLGEGLIGNFPVPFRGAGASDDISEVFMLLLPTVAYRRVQ